MSLSLSKWKQLTGKIKERWGDLTDDDLQAADGHAEYLVGKLQERYGWSKERAEQEVRDFSDRL
ncbi:CsbD family protein [Pseudomonas aeruginosa]|uniref:CsbD family protein n=1 Tax=Pseudomonas aeruginosa TaxID=287 RepID=UPI003CC5068E